MPDRRKDFGTLVRAVRERLGYKKPEDLAAAAGISKRSVDAVELGERTGPKTLRAVARALGWREADVLGHIAGDLAELPEPTPPPIMSGELAPLDEVLEADLDGLKKLGRMYAWYEARQAGRAPNVTDQERFMLWALQTRAEHAQGIKPPEQSNRDVS